MAAEIRQQYPEARIDLKRSSGGRFEVLKDGVPIYEKSRTGRFPDPGEVLNLLAK